MADWRCFLEAYFMYMKYASQSMRIVLLTLNLFNSIQLFILPKDTI